MNDFDRLMNEEMMKVDPQQLKNIAIELYTLYTELIKAGFTKAQAMDLVKHTLNPSN